MCAYAAERIEHACGMLSRRGCDRNGAYLWDGFPRRRVVIASKQMNGPDANRPRHRDRIINISYPSDYDVASSGRCAGQDRFGAASPRAGAVRRAAFEHARARSRCCIFA